MFSSVRSKIICLVTFIMAVTAAPTMYFTLKEVGSIVLNAEKASAANVLHLVRLNIRGEFRKIILDKAEKVTRVKQEVRNMAEVGASVVNELTFLSDAGALDKQEVLNKALNWVNHSSFKNGDLFVFDDSGMVLAHPIPEMYGTSIKNLRDMKWRQISKVMAPGTLDPKGDSAVFRWKYFKEEKEQKKMGYFTPLPKCGWTIGAVMDISAIEAEAQRGLQRIIRVHRESFSDIRVGRTGSVFLFNDKNEILIPPSGYESYDYAAIRNVITGNPLLKDLIAAGKAENQSVSYIHENDPEKKLMTAHIRYIDGLDWYVGVTVPVDEIQGPAKRIVTRQSIILAAVFLASLIIAFILVDRISRPLNTLALHAKKLASHDFTKEDTGQNPIQNLTTRYKDEVGRLAQAFVFMEAELRKNIRDLMETTATKERIEGELNVAREIQMGILPKTFPGKPDSMGFDLYALIEPAKEVGGDLYDFFMVDDDHLCFTLGDVSDKGVPAALFMVITRTLIKTLAQKGVPVADLMSQVNNLLAQDNPNAMFVTLVMAVINLKTGHLRYANGGHNPPIILPQGRDPYYKKDLSGPIVGAIDDIPYSEISFSLNPGDAVFLYTDGVTEAMNPEKEQFSEELLISEVTANKEEHCAKVVKSVLEKVKAHARTAPQSDDITVLMIRYNGEVNSSKSDSMSDDKSGTS